MARGELATGKARLGWHPGRAKWVADATTMLMVAAAH